MKKSVRSRILTSYMIITLFIISIVEIIVFLEVKNYYYNSIESTLEKQAQNSAYMFQNYINRDDNKNSMQMLKYFAISVYSLSNAQVQIIDTNKMLLEDTNGYNGKCNVDFQDINAALKGAKGKRIGIEPSNNEKIMSISMPLKDGDEIRGIIRLSTSLEYTDISIKNIYRLSILCGIVILIIFFLLSLKISYTITSPVKILNESAKKIAGGQFATRAPKIYDDEIGELSDTLNYLSSEILKNDKLKNEFISSVSHEIRTPLTILKGWIVALKTGDFEDKEELKYGLNVIDKETDRLTGLVEELLDFSKFMGGRIRLNITNFNVVFFVQDIVKQMMPRAKRLGIKLELRVKENINKEFHIEGDQSRLKQVFINLIDNSFKFIEEDGLIIISVECCGENRELVRFSVKDNGIGIKNEYLDKVKEKFYKGDSSRGGSGIGLAICDEIIKLHHGTMDIKSEEGIGTEVIIKIPVDFING